MSELEIAKFRYWWRHQILELFFLSKKMRHLFEHRITKLQVERWPKVIEKKQNGQHTVWRSFCFSLKIRLFILHRKTRSYLFGQPDLFRCYYLLRIIGELVIFSFRRQVILDRSFWSRHARNLPIGDERTRVNFFDRLARGGDVSFEVEFENKWHHAYRETASMDCTDPNAS